MSARVTQAELNAARKRYQTTAQATQAANEIYLGVLREYLAASAECIRLEALAQSAYDYLRGMFERAITTRPLSATKLDPHHDPVEVQAALDRLVTEGLFRQVGRRYTTTGGAS